jgi:hypothetical protein
MSCWGAPGTSLPLVFARRLGLFATLSVVSAASFVTGCGEANISESRALGTEPTGASGAEGNDVARTGGVDELVAPVVEGAPGGPIGAGDVVGCQDADRPAQRLSNATEVCEATGGGRCWYIDPNGSDGNDGSFASPYLKPQTAIDQAGAGDVIYLRGGVYDDTHAEGSKGAYTDTTNFFAILGNDASGTQANPITIRSFPEERACIDGGGLFEIGSPVSWWNIEDMTLIHGAIQIEGDAPDDIGIRRMEIFDFEAVNSGQNIGLIRVDRGDNGGAERITIESNILHEVYAQGHTPLDGYDFWHMGAITVLSCETYKGIECGGNGALTIQNNHIYRTPSAIFLKNPSRGPTLIRGNVIEDTYATGNWYSANITIDNNVWIDTGGNTASTQVRAGGYGGPFGGGDIFLRSGHNFTFTNNTFIGRNMVIAFNFHASGHTFTGNVVEGLTLDMGDASWDQIGVFGNHAYSPSVDTATVLEDSELAANNTFDDNCYVAATTDFIAYGLRRSSGTDHNNLTEAASRMGHDTSSVVTTNRATAFEDFGAGNYRIAQNGPCAGHGATVPDWVNW